MKLAKVQYDRLNARQKENFNLQKLSAVLAEYGFVTHRLSDDWEGPDLIARHIHGDVLFVQLKSRLSIFEKYRGKALYIAFPHGDLWYLFPHDKFLAKVLEQTTVASTVSWSKQGKYSWPKLSAQMLELLEPYRISGSTKPIRE
jgi:hypothetical protein